MELLDAFLTYLSVEKGLSKNTLDSYSTDLKKFLVFLGQRESAPGVAGAPDIVDFIEKLRNGGYSVSTVCRYISSIKALFKYMLIENLREEDPSENIQTPKRWERLPKALSIDEVMELLDAGFAGTTALRDSAMLELLYSSGLRVSELVSLKTADIHFDAGFVRVLGKGSKERVVPMNTRAVVKMKRYIGEERQGLTERGGRLSFCDEEGKSHDPSALLADDEGIGKEIGDRDFTSYRASLLRNPSSRRRRGSEVCPKDARPFRYLDDADLHEGDDRQDQEGL